jgi:hypothetical protein
MCFGAVRFAYRTLQMRTLRVTNTHPMRFVHDQSFVGAALGGSGFSRDAFFPNTKNIAAKAAPSVPDMGMY